MVRILISSFLSFAPSLSLLVACRPGIPPRTMTWSENIDRGAGQFSGTPRYRAASRRGVGPASRRFAARGPDTISRPASSRLMRSSWKGSAAEWPLRASLRPTILPRTRTRKPRAYERAAADLSAADRGAVNFLPLFLFPGICTASRYGWEDH